MELINTFHRHDLIWFTSQGWNEIYAQLTPVQQLVLLDWQAADFPAVVRRRDADADQSELCVGFTLPPQHGERLRIAARLRKVHITEHQSPLALSTVIPMAKPGWRDQLRMLQSEAARSGIRFRVYGALAMQFLTGQSYLHEASAIDLLFAPQTRQQLSEAIRLLAAYQHQLPLDGEILFPADLSVAWKEWLIAEQVSAPASDQRVLVKDLQQVRLYSREQLLQSLPPL